MLRAELDQLPGAIELTPAARTCFKLHRAWPRSTKTARKMAAGEIPMDWGYAENLAYATLVAGWLRLRLVGQDAGPRHVLPSPRRAARPETGERTYAAARTVAERPPTSPSSTRCCPKKR
ncbi:MAG: hypothetical protein LKM39_03695 [Chiayiivirga sp.]|nr:hypothetical protein [Chiayiivirga sp.]